MVADLVLELDAVERVERVALERAVLRQQRRRRGGGGGRRRRGLDTRVSLVVGALFDAVAPLLLLQAGAARRADARACDGGGQNGVNAASWTVPEGIEGC